MTTPGHRRRHEYYSDSHEPTARQRRRIRRRHDARVRNRADDRFGKSLVGHRNDRGSYIAGSPAISHLRL